MNKKNYPKSQNLLRDDWQTIDYIYKSSNNLIILLNGVNIKRL